ncbi:MAG: hypothetical protein M5R36_06355 [Deltaproteobacteria bacterium]|nr:hypothetical protein [Deltaproteobacteria bacterium]
MSRNLSILKSAGLVAARREGRWIHYRLDFDGADASARQFLGVAAASLNGDKQIRRDRAALKRLLKLSREELCRRGAEAA